MKLDSSGTFRTRKSKIRERYYVSLHRRDIYLRLMAAPRLRNNTSSDDMICVAIVYCVSKYEILAQHSFLSPSIVLVVALFSCSISHTRRHFCGTIGKARESPKRDEAAKILHVARDWQIA